MKRTVKNENPHIADAILISDLHLTDSTPVSRVDDYQKAQQDTLRFLQQLSNNHRYCPILCAGDVFDHWKASPWLMQWAYYHLPRPFICIPGQHDMPGHSLQELGRSALALLNVVMPSNELRVLRHGQIETDNLCIVGVPFGELATFDPVAFAGPRSKTRRKILMLHELIWPNSAPSWGTNKGRTGDGLLTEYGEYFDLILTGDNHQCFAIKGGATWLVNPGSTMKMTADQESHEPKCFLYYASTNSIVAVTLPDRTAELDRRHVDTKKEKDARIAAYIERMNKDWDVGTSFQKSLEMFFTQNNTPRKVREIIWQALEQKTC